MTGVKKFFQNKRNLKIIFVFLLVVIILSGIVFNAKKIVTTTLQGKQNTYEFDNQTEFTIGATSTGQYQWTKKDSSTWESTGNHGVPDSTSTLTSNEFTIYTDSILSFEWSVSSEQTHDYVYYTITNTKTHTTIGGEDTKISGQERGKEYSSLRFDKVTKTLTPGTYKIEFVYKKDHTVDTEPDAAYGLKKRMVHGKVLEIMEYQIQQVH